MSRERPTASEFLSSPYDPQLEREFFGRVFLPNRTVKTTDANRLDDLNAIVLPHIDALPIRPLRILDVAVSSGISTAEWHESLIGIEHEMTATDLCINATLRGNGKFSVLQDSHGRVLHFDMLGKGCPPYQQGVHLHALIHTFTVAASKIASKSEPVKLLSKRVNGLAAKEDDLTKPNPPDFVGAFDVIRAANILNLAYFPEVTLRTMIANLKHRLAPNGLLIICRTVKGEGNHGTIFKESQPIARIGNGSEVEHLI